MVQKVKSVIRKKTDQYSGPTKEKECEDGINERYAKIYCTVF